MTNPLIDDRNIKFLLQEVLQAERLCTFEYFSDHDSETFSMYLAAARKLAQESLFPNYRQVDAAPPELKDGKIEVHPSLHHSFSAMAELGVVAATRPYSVGGQQLPFVVFALANAYLMAANLSAYAYLGLTTGAARLIESFGSEELRREFMRPMYAGTWTGTMALTEPQAGSSLADVQTEAVAQPQGHYLMRGTKIFLSGGEHDLTENIVHLTLARVPGAPAGIRGLSLFAVPKRRMEDGALVANDAIATGVFHKIGWRGVPSIALTLGDAGDCHGYLVGELHRGLRYMFQMMNEARLMVGLNGVATASVAYLASLQYAQERPQGRAAAQRDPASPQVPIIQHADVRRMLLRQKSIVEGGLALAARCSYGMDVAEHAESEEERKKAAQLVDLLTPVAKTFPAEYGFESNTLAIQIHGGYGYTSEYLPEAWWRDQKLNSIHEGTTGIQGMDLLGRKVLMNHGSSLMLLQGEIHKDVEDARAAGVDEEWCSRLLGSMAALGAVTQHLGQLAAGSEGEAVLRHSHNYMEMFSVIVVAWQWLVQAAAAKKALAGSTNDEGFYQGKLAAAQYWIQTELTKVGHLAALCRGGEDSFSRMRPDWF
jgi:alkylation response protein AidB-like acyl-CoA dehydrogenase